MTDNVHLVFSNETENGTCKPSSGGALFFYLKTDKTTFFLGSPTPRTISSRQLVTNNLGIAMCNMQTATETSTRSNDELRSALLSVFESAEEAEAQSNVNLTTIISNFSRILNNIDEEFIVDSEISQVCNPRLKSI